MTIQRLHHVQITVPSDCVTDARDFYLDVLGLSEIPKPTTLQHRGGFWMRLGMVDIHVGLQDGVNRESSRQHLAYQVDDIAYWRERLSQHAINILESIPIEGYHRFEFRDPFGNRVEMIQPIDEAHLSR